MVGAVDAGRVVDEVGVDRGRRSRANSIRARWVSPRLPPSATTRQRSSVGVDADRVAGAVQGVGVGLGRGLDDRADAAVPEHVDRRAEDRADDLVGREHRRPRCRARRAPARAARCAWRCAARRRRPRRSRRGRSRPTRSRPARRAACARRTPLGRVGVGVDEDVAVVVGGDEADLVAQQHPVAEDVAGHVADADGGELVDGRVQVELAEVALERLPRAARGDPQRLVVVALRAARGERVAEPEAVAPGDAVGGVRERRRALVGRDDEVGVVVVEHAHALGVHDLALDEVVGEVEQAADEGHVAALDLGLQARPGPPGAGAGRSRPWRRRAR